MVHRLLLMMLVFVLGQSLANGEEVETIHVEGRKINLIGEAISASEGVVGQREIAMRPMLRTGEVLELVPGLVVTQHSGSGKANQYFLRGFNLDHGTDFATFVDGMPVNLRSHGHGQGYTDLNFLIPETIGKMTYKKGAYYADVGDFSGAGSASIESVSKLEHNVASIGIGENGYQRLLLMNDFQWQGGNTLFVLESNRYNGPWSDIDEDIKKTNVLLKHSRALTDGEFNITLMTYDNSWNSADQIPARAVNNGLIDELGSLDDSVGGQSSRYSLSSAWQQGAWRGSAYFIDYDLNLWSNFTYFLEDEVNGDQFEQVDERQIYGGQIEYRLKSASNDHPVNQRFGLQLRVEDIEEVGLYQTLRRQRLGVTRSDSIKQRSLGLFWEHRAVWGDHLRTVLGARYDRIDFDVKDRAGINRFGVDLSNNGGTADDDLLSAKGSVIYAINDAWEAYVSAGQGFHSNDARGVTIAVDPTDRSAVNRVDPLVRSTGFEGGLRGVVGERFNASMALWKLLLDSELLFVGDAGNTEASRPSERKGIEFIAYYYFTDQLSADLEYAYTDAEFRDRQPEGNHIPGAVKNVIQAGLSLDLDKGWFGSLRLRHFGKRPLVEDKSVESDGTTTWNLRLGYQRKNWLITADLLNIADSDDHDIDYFYESRLGNDPAGTGVGGVHYHVIEPRTVRVAAEYRF